MEVRDPIHGAVQVSDAEAFVVDHPFVQRLRGIKQMGFSELPFPGAVHSRYAHSIGVMELAGRAFDAVVKAERGFLPATRRSELRACVRLAALCHDLGHAPFSHCTEFAMPTLRALEIRAYNPDAVAGRLAAQATHEDYTIGILTASSLATCIAAHFSFTGKHVAGLVSHEVIVDDDFFVVDGLDWRRLLSQLISSELDVDRLDYLQRDSYYSGARYGQIDVGWLIGNLEFQVQNDTVSLALDHRAIYAFDDFMIARYHMFVMVYFHHKSVVFEEMLKRHFTSADVNYPFPTDMEGYLHLDDVHLHSYLRGAADPWARRIVERRPYRRALELHGSFQEVQTDDAVAVLAGAGIDCLQASSTGKLSRYNVMGQKREKAPRIYVVQRQPGCLERVLSLEDATRIFERYQDERHIARVYVPEDRVDEAQAMMRKR
jgi:HD superfamily phosphohydrolase